MALHEHAFVEGDIKVVAEVRDSLCFCLAAAVGEKDERDAMRLEVAKGLRSAWERLRATEKDAIDTIKLSVHEILEGDPERRGLLTQKRRQN